MVFETQGSREHGIKLECMDREHENGNLGVGITKNYLGEQEAIENHKIDQ